MPAKSDRSELIKKELEKIRRRGGGRLTPRMVVEAAKAKAHPLHDEFEWDDSVAAQKYREDQARELIRYVTIEVVTESRTFDTVIYVRDQEAKSNEQGYVALTAEELEREHATKIMLSELQRCESAIERARGITAVLDAYHPGLSNQLETMLGYIVSLRASLGGDEAGIDPDGPRPS